MIRVRGGKVLVRVWWEVGEDVVRTVSYVVVSRMRQGKEWGAKKCDNE